MKGLLLKDFYMTIKYCRMLLLLVLLFAAVSVMSNSVFITSYPFIIAGVLPVSLYAYDERSGWCGYADAMPYSRAQRVSAKYISALTLICLVLLISMAGRELTEDNFIEDFSLLLVMCGMGLLSAACMLPFVMRFGSEKGRWAYYAIIVLACLAAFAASDSGGGSGSTIAAGPAPLGILAACAAIFALSWFVSIRIYEKREL